MTDEAAEYDRRWHGYTERSLALLRPWIQGRALGRVLDVGCGTANLLPRLAAWNASAQAYVGVDPAADMLRAGEPKALGAAFPVARVAAPAGALPFATGTIDTAVTASSLHEWPDPLAGLREIRRVVRPDGMLLLLDWDGATLPMRLLDGWMRMTGVRYHRMYTAGAMERMLVDAGFRMDARTHGSAGGPWRLAGFRARRG